MICESKYIIKRVKRNAVHSIPFGITLTKLISKDSIKWDVPVKFL